MTEKASRFDFAKGTAEHVKYEMKGFEDRSRATIKKFSDNLAINPAYAFEWAESAIEAAGELEAAMCVVNWLARKEAGETFTRNDMPSFLADAIKELMNRAMHEVEYPSKSSHTVHVEMARQKARGYFMIAHRLTAISEGRW